MITRYNLSFSLSLSLSLSLPLSRSLSNSLFQEGYMGVMVITAGLIQVPETCKVKVRIRDLFMDEYVQTWVFSNKNT